jgi:hypothetical protein
LLKRSRVFVFGVVLVLFFVVALGAAVMIGVQFAGFFGVMGGVGGMAGGDVGVVARHLDVVLGVMLGRFAMVQGGVFVMLGGQGVVILGGMFDRHGGVLSGWCGRVVTMRRRLSHLGESASPD